MTASATEIQVRALEPDDWPQVADIYPAGIATGNATFETAPPSWKDWDSSHRPDLRFVATDHDQVVGWLAASGISDRCCYAGVIEHSVYVHPAHQGRGIGRTLLTALIDAAEGAGIWTIQTGIFGGVAGAGACLGSVVGGIVVEELGWRWIFLINVPIAIALAGLVFHCVPSGERTHRGSADVLGAVTVTTGLLGIVFAINRSVDYGWASLSTLGVLAGGAAMLGLFVIVEQRVTVPIVPLSIFRLRTLTAASIVAVLAIGSFFGMAYLGTFFIQEVLGYSPLRAGAAGLITAVASVVASIAIAPRVIGRIGAARTLVVGQGFAAAGLVYFARVPLHADYWTDLFPAYLALGIGIGLSGVAVQIAAFTGVNNRVSGLAGGMISTAQEVGSALGLAIIATAAFSVSGASSKSASGSHNAVHAVAQTAGFHRGALVAAGFSVAALLTAWFVLRPAERTAAEPGPSESIVEPLYTQHEGGHVRVAGN